MKNFLIRLVSNAVALSVAAYLIDGIQLSGGTVALLMVALVFGILNAVLKPVLTFFSLPFILLTFGLFVFVVNASMLLVTARLVDDLTVSGWGSALLGSLVISIVTMFLGAALDDGERQD
jgi:putative membrane protein